LPPVELDGQETRLSTLSYLVLGLIHRYGPQTSYGLKGLAATSIGHLWPQGHTRLYAEPARLAARDLLSVTVERTGRRRRFYEITPSGESQLQNWLRGADDKDAELRDPSLVRLLVLEGSADAADQEQLRTLARNQASEHRRRWAAITRIAAEPSAHPDTAGNAEMHRLAASIEHAVAEFWTMRTDPTSLEPPQPFQMPEDEEVRRAFATFLILADPTRIKILWALLHGEGSLPSLAELAECTSAAVVQHLTRLEQSGLLRLDLRDDRVHLHHEGRQLRELLSKALRQHGPRDDSAPAGNTTTAAG
jgi:PadR family transcriptional regulator, regulatory protein AphA